jgi:hypothetical protein
MTSKYCAEQLEICISSGGYNAWHWAIAVKGKGFISSGEIKGARSKAVRRANDELERLLSDPC